MGRKSSHVGESMNGGLRVGDILAGISGKLQKISLGMEQGELSLAVRTSHQRQ